MKAGKQRSRSARRRERDNVVYWKTKRKIKNDFVGAPDADILLEAIRELRKTTTAGAATFLVKVKAHQEEPANEEADIQANKAIGKDVPTEWHDRTNRAIFTWQEPRRKGGMVSYED